MHHVLTDSLRYVAGWVIMVLTTSLAAFASLGWLKRGVKNAYWSMLDKWTKLEELGFDWRYGTDTMGNIEVADMQVNSPTKQHSRGYQPSTARPLRYVLRTLDLPAHSVLVDLGCGKGKVLMLASELNIRRVVGIEFSKELCAIAERNLAAFRRRAHVRADVRVVNSDVLQYKINDDENVFFVFNSFDDVILRRLLDKIGQSLLAQPRRLWLIYQNPQHLDVIERCGLFRRIGFHKFSGPGHAFAVYESR